MALVARHTQQSSSCKRHVCDARGMQWIMGPESRSQRVATRWLTLYSKARVEAIHVCESNTVGTRHK